MTRILPLQIPSPRCEIERVITALAVQKALSALTPRRREVVVQIYLQDRSFKQVADALGVPVGTIKSRAHAALRALRGELSEVDAAGEPAARAA